ncbi:aliphatic sulfonate ABC transporter substrate-binding protein [Mycolicibacterium cosmeticum]|uniref:ABC transporter substrate-binding protein n=1 Tax=Mycolicibacterium cosmeticum TaxID=258533 RepID=UPI00320466E9
MVVALVLFVGGCGSGGDDGASDTVRIGTFASAVDYAPFYVARKQRLFESAVGAGTKVEYVEFDSAPAITEALETNRVDMVFMAEPPALIAAAAGVHVKIAALGASLIQDIVVPIDSKIASAADLSGARVGVLAGTSSHYALIKIAKDAGVDPKSIQVIDMAPPDAKAAFESGQLDAWAVWPPFVQQQLVQKTGRLLPAGDAAIQSIAVARPGLAEDSPTVYSGLVGAIAKAKEFIRASAAEAKSIVAAEVRVDPAVVELAWPRHDFTATLTPQVIADIQAKADFLADARFIQHKLNVEELVGPAQ